MSTVELQNSIIRQVLEIDNIETLNRLNSILSENPIDSVYQLSLLETQVLNESIADYEKGNVVDNELVFSKINKWLEK